MNVFIEPKWEEVSSSEGAFSVMMPGTPSETKKDKSGTSFSTELHTFLLDQGDAYAISYYDIPGDVPLKQPKEVLEVNRDGMVSGTKGKLVSEQVISLNGHPGIKVVIEVSDVPTMQGKLFFVDRRIYTLIATTSNPEDGERFLNSFKLLDK